MQQIQEYFKPDRAVPFILDSMMELFNTMKVHSINVEEVEKTFIDIFINHDKYDPTLIVHSLRVLHQSAVAAQNTLNRKDFDVKKEEERLKKEYTLVDAASELGVGYSTLKLLIKANRIEVKRYSSKNIKVVQSEIDRFLSEKSAK